MIEGGLAEFSIVPVDEHRSVVKIGDKRLFDLIEMGEGLVAEYKPSKRDTIQANPVELMIQLATKLNVHGPLAV